MSEKPSDGTVAMHYGDVEDGDILASEEHLPTLPNTVGLLPINLSDVKWHFSVFTYFVVGRCIVFLFITCTMQPYSYLALKESMFFFQHYG